MRLSAATILLLTICGVAFSQSCNNALLTTEVIARFGGSANVLTTPRTLASTTPVCQMFANQSVCISEAGFTYFAAYVESYKSNFTQRSQSRDSSRYNGVGSNLNQQNQTDPRTQNIIQVGGTFNQTVINFNMSGASAPYDFSKFLQLVAQKGANQYIPPSDNQINKQNDLQMADNSKNGRPPLQGINNNTQQAQQLVQQNQQQQGGQGQGGQQGQSGQSGQQGQGQSGAQGQGQNGTQGQSGQGQQGQTGQSGQQQQGQTGQQQQGQTGQQQQGQTGQQQQGQSGAQGSTGSQQQGQQGAQNGSKPANGTQGATSSQPQQGQTGTQTGAGAQAGGSGTQAGAGAGAQTGGQQPTGQKRFLQQTGASGQTGAQGSAQTGSQGTGAQTGAQGSAQTGAQGSAQTGQQGQSGQQGQGQSGQSGQGQSGQQGQGQSGQSGQGQSGQQGQGQSGQSQQGQSGQQGGQQGSNAQNQGPPPTDNSGWMTLQNNLGQAKSKCGVAVMKQYYYATCMAALTGAATNGTVSGDSSNPVVTVSADACNGYKSKCTDYFTYASTAENTKSNVDNANSLWAMQIYAIVSNSSISDSDKSTALNVYATQVLAALNTANNQGDPSKKPWSAISCNASNTGASDCNYICTKVITATGFSEDNFNLISSTTTGAVASSRALGSGSVILSSGSTGINPDGAISDSSSTVQVSVQSVVDKSSASSLVASLALLIASVVILF